VRKLLERVSDLIDRPSKCALYFLPTSFILVLSQKNGRWFETKTAYSIRWRPSECNPTSVLAQKHAALIKHCTDLGERDLVELQPTEQNSSVTKYHMFFITAFPE
jgi:hypothetical protein